MRDANKTKSQLLKELSDARCRIAELEEVEGHTNATWCQPLPTGGIPQDSQRKGRTEDHEQGQAREPLRASGERYASILRKAPTGIGVSVHRIIEGVNEVVCNMTGIYES
jgi:hypothetical protein